MTDIITPAPEGVTPEAVADLARRLRGEYRIPITDGLGAAGGEEPDNEHEFVRTFFSPPIQKDAAAMLEALAADRDAQKARADAVEKERDRFEAALARCCLVGGQTYYIERIQAAEAKVAKLVKALREIKTCTTEYGGAAKALRIINAALRGEAEGQP